MNLDWAGDFFKLQQAVILTVFNEIPDFTF